MLLSYACITPYSMSIHACLRVYEACLCRTSAEEGAVIFSGGPMSMNTLQCSACCGTTQWSPSMCCMVVLCILSFPHLWLHLTGCTLPGEKIMHVTVKHLDFTACIYGLCSIGV